MATITLNSVATAAAVLLPSAAVRTPRCSALPHLPPPRASSLAISHRSNLIFSSDTKKFARFQVRATDESSLDTEELIAISTKRFDPNAGSSTTNPSKVKTLMHYFKAQRKRIIESDDDEVEVKSDLGDEPQVVPPSDKSPKRPGAKKKSLALKLHRRTKHLISKVVYLFTRQHDTTYKNQVGQFEFNQAMWTRMFSNEPFDANKYRPLNVVEPSASFLAALNDDLPKFDGYGDNDEVDGDGASHNDKGHHWDGARDGQEVSEAAVDPGVGGKIMPYAGVDNSTRSSLEREFNK